MLTGSGIGSILIPPATQWFISDHGWRSGYLFLGGIALLGLPLTALLVRNDSATRSASTQPCSTALAGVSVAIALRSRPFWIRATIIMLSALSENGLVTNMAAMLHEHGVTPASSAALPPATSSITIPPSASRP